MHTITALVSRIAGGHTSKPVCGRILSIAMESYMLSDQKRYIKNHICRRCCCYWPLRVENQEERFGALSPTVPAWIYGCPRLSKLWWTSSFHKVYSWYLLNSEVINLYWALGWWILVNNTVIGGGSSLFDNNRYHHGNNWKWSLPIGMNAWIIDLLTSALPGYANNDYFNPKHVRWILFLNLLDLKCCKLFNQIEHELNPLNYGWFWYHVHLELGVHPLVHLMLLFQTFLLGSSILKVKVVLIVQAPMFAKAYLKPRFNLPVRKIQESVWKYKIEMDEQFLFENAPGQFGSFLQVQILFDTKLTLQDCQLIGCERCPSFAIRSMFTKLNCFCFVKEKILVIKANRTTYLMDSAWKHLVSNRIRIPPRILNIPHCPQRKNHLTSKGWKN